MNDQNDLLFLFYYFFITRIVFIISQCLNIEIYVYGLFLELPIACVVGRAWINSEFPGNARHF